MEMVEMFFGHLKYIKESHYLLTSSREGVQCYKKCKKQMDNVSLFIFLKGILNSRNISVCAIEFIAWILQSMSPKTSLIVSLIN